MGIELRTAIERELHGVQRRLVTVEHDQPIGAEAMQLPAELGADRSAGTGDQHLTILLHT
ncbi:MAG: hypothetical protein R2755_28035 [Acidimicrobiales bacterium]